MCIKYAQLFCMPIKTEGSTPHTEAARLGLTLTSSGRQRWVVLPVTEACQPAAGTQLGPRGHYFSEQCRERKPNSRALRGFLVIFDCGGGGGGWQAPWGRLVGLRLAAGSGGLVVEGPCIVMVILMRCCYLSTAVLC